MRVLKTILVLILGFVIGFLSAFGAIIGGGYYIVNNVTPESAESMIQGFAPDFALPSNLPQELMTMTIMQIVQEVMDIAGNLDTLSLNELQTRLGYQIPLQLSNGTDVSFLFAPIMDLPITTIPSNMNLVVDNLTLNTLITLGVLDEGNLPSLPMFSNPESMNTPLMSLFSDMGSIRISDVIDLYTGDYYPNDNGNFVLVSCNYIDYDSNNVLHNDLTRYKEGYVLNTEGDFVRVDGAYISYNSSTHSGYQRFSAKMLPSFTGDKVMSNAVFESYNLGTPAHQLLDRYMQPEKSAAVLLALGNSYINSVPDSDPNGMTISTTINTLQVKDIINTEGGSTILLALADAYIGDTVPASDPSGKTISQTVDTLQIGQVIDIYEEDVYESGVLLHSKSNQVLIAIKDAYIGSNPPEGGLTIDQTINTLQVKSIIEIIPDNIYDNDGQLIKEKSSAMLVAIMDAYIGATAPEGFYTVSDIIGTLQVKNVINIYNGSEYVVNTVGEFVIDGYTDYNELLHSALQRYSYVVEDANYIIDNEGELVLNYISYDVSHDGYTRYSLAAKSSNMLVAIQDAYLGDNPPVGGLTISETVDSITLGQIIDITDDSTQILKELKDTTISNLNSTLNSMKLKQTMTIYTEDIFDIEGQIIFNKSNTVLIALQDAYIGAVPIDDPLGLTISDTLDNLTLNQLVNIYDGTEYIAEALGDYYRIPAVYAPYDELTYIDELRYRLSDVNGGFFPDDSGEWILTAEAQYVLVSDPAHTDYLDANPTNPPLPRYTIATKSSNLMTSLSGSKLDTIDADINNLELGEILTITNSSSKVLRSLQFTTLNDLDSKINTFLLSDVIDIYDGYEYVEDINGDYVIDGYEAYNEFNQSHLHLTRYTYDGVNYTEDALGDLVPAYVTYDPSIHIENIRYTHPTASSLILRSMKAKGASINNMSATIEDLQLKDVVAINSSSSKILQTLQDVYIGTTAPIGELTLDQKINILTLSDVVDIYEQDEYYEDISGDYVLDYVLYDDTNPYHATLTRYSDDTGLIVDPLGDYVLYYTDYAFPLHDGDTRYNKHSQSTIGLITLKDTNINNLDTHISTLKLKDVQVIYDGYEFYEKNTGTYIIAPVTSYELYDSMNNYHKHLDRYTENGVEYTLDVNGDYVPYYRLAYVTEDDIFPRYALRAPSSKLLRSLSNASLTDLGSSMDTLLIGDMIQITDTSPKILKRLAASSLLTLEGTIFDLQLKDVMDIYSEDVYELDENGYFVLDVAVYVEYDSLNPAHDSLDRYTRTIGVASDNNVYRYDIEGDYVLELGTPDIYVLDVDFLQLDLPRYTLIGIKSPNILISLQNSYLYDDTSGDTLQIMLENLTLVDVLGTPIAGSLLEAISYDNGDPLTGTPVKVNDIEPRVAEVINGATLGKLAEWGIIDTTGFDAGQQASFDAVSGMSIQQFIEFLFPPTP